MPPAGNTWIRMMRGTSIITDKHGEYQPRAVVLQAKPG
jgi:hypothetical protein